MSITINCQDCKDQWEASDDAVPLGIQDGSFVVMKGYYGSLRYFGICSTCTLGYKKKQVVEEDEFVTLYRTRDRIKALHPELTIQQASTRAVEILNDPRNEPNPDYRTYLLEWIPREDVEEAA